MKIVTIAMPATIGSFVALCTSMNIGYGEIIASSAISLRKRALP